MSTKRTTARIATIAATAAAAAVMVGGTALAAGLGSDVSIPAPTLDQQVAPAIDLAPSPTPSPAPSSDPVSTVTGTVNGLLDTAKNALGLGPKPTASPSPSATASVPPNPGPRPLPQPRPTTGTAPRPALPHTGGGGVGSTSGSLSGFGTGLSDRRPALADLPTSATESVRGVGAVAAPALSRSVTDALPGDGTEPNPMPGLLVVAAAACVAAVAAGNAEVWRRRLAEQLG